jgi:2'-5' RNA ligase
VRLFVAVELPPPARAAAAIASQILRERVIHDAPRARLTWVAADRMHITVRFLGETSPDSVNTIATSLAAPLNSARFTLALGDAGAFPARGAPRALWLAISDGGAGLRALEEEVSARLVRVGVPRESRPFSPHLTLARVRDPAGLPGARIVQGVTAPPHPGGLVDAITLFESRLSPKGPMYTALQHTPLREG